jgi:hypothetical protein
MTLTSYMLKVGRIPRISRLAFAGVLLLVASFTAAGQPADPPVETPGNISELRDKQRALLVVFKSRVVDVDNPERAIIDDVLKADPQPKGRYRFVYNELALKLNKYINKYRSLSSAKDLADAEYVIYFNVVEFRRILNAIYPYGELFVIVKGSPRESKPPRIVWRAKKIMVGTDAVGEFVKALKALRGEG